MGIAAPEISGRFFFCDTEHFRFEDSKRIMSPEKFRAFRETGPWGPFLKSPETFRAQFRLT